MLVVVGLGGDGRGPVFGKYLIPVAGQLELAPAGLNSGVRLSCGGDHGWEEN